MTGATGYLGGWIAKRLVEGGFQVRALAREQSNVMALTRLGVEVVTGDLGIDRSVAAAVEGVDVVVHAGAGTRGTPEDLYTATVQGTRNILDACRASNVRKLVYISSCSVYQTSGYMKNQIVTEDAQLERYPQRRGPYSAAKLRAETLVAEVMGRQGCPIVVLRLGTLCGPGSDPLAGMLGIALARRVFIVFGTGVAEMPLVHVRDAVDAIVACMLNSAADNQVFNVVGQPVSKKSYVDLVVRPLYPRAAVIYCPMPLLTALTWVQEKLFTAMGKPPLLSVYRLASSQKPVKYSAGKIERAIGWRSQARFDDRAG